MQIKEPITAHAYHTVSGKVLIRSGKWFIFSAKEGLIAVNEAERERSRTGSWVVAFVLNYTPVPVFEILRAP